MQNIRLTSKDFWFCTDLKHDPQTGILGRFLGAQLVGAWSLHDGHWGGGEAGKIFSITHKNISQGTNLAEEGVVSISGESSFMVARLGGELESIVLASSHLVQPNNF